MSLDKAIKHGKEKRKPYRDSRQFDRHCCNHGNCDWCNDNRLYQRTKEEQKANSKIKEESQEPKSYFIMDADLEEPNCYRCDHAHRNDDEFCEKCGPKWGWAGYRRTEEL